ncbi:VWA domain-containing protein [bacterium]|nr:VWA domain-containing protein [bacterium]
MTSFKPIAFHIAAVLAAAGLAGAPASAKTPAEGAQFHSYVLLDRTGSMESIWPEALSSVNAYAKGLASLDGGPSIDADVTVAAFDSQDGFQFDVVRKGVDPRKWRNVTNEDVSPRGMTPLYDAIGRIVGMAEADRPEKAVIVIMTDGEENASRELTREGAKAALDRIRSKGWEVVFLGAEFAKFNDAEGVGQSTSRNMAVGKDQLNQSMERLAKKSRDYATGAAPTVEFDAEDRAIAKEEDVKQRKGGN